MKNFSKALDMKIIIMLLTRPWRPDHAELPDNYDLSKRRLLGLLKRLRNEPETLKEYDNVIRDQLNKGIVESVPERNEGSKRTHYLPLGGDPPR